MVGPFNPTRVGVRSDGRRFDRLIPGEPNAAAPRERVVVELTGSRPANASRTSRGADLSKVERWARTLGT